MVREDTCANNHGLMVSGDAQQIFFVASILGFSAFGGLAIAGGVGRSKAPVLCPNASLEHRTR